jgi:hypothetical protein
VIMNLIAKAATSPFALLGAVFGESEALSALEFEYGTSEISEAGTKKLDLLTKALNERPSLKMEIAGYADPEKDRDGLRDHLFNKKIKTQKIKDLAKKGTGSVSADSIDVSQAEYPIYLKMAYKEEKFPKPRNFIGIAKDLPLPEMEKLMRTHIQITDDNLRQLASQRALEAKDYLLKSGKIEQERIFLITPKSLKPEKKEKMRESRVDFTLK